MTAYKAAATTTLQWLQWDLAAAAASTASMFTPKDTVLPTLTTMTMLV